METDVLIIGAGAAGLMCAIEAGKRGRRVVVIDHARKPAEKIRISGGGRCNFTNLHATAANYLSQNPRYCVSALARYTPQDFVQLLERYGVRYHEKKLGQLFCDGSAQQVIDVLLAECREANVQIVLGTEIEQLARKDASFSVRSSTTEYTCQSLVVACGGLSIPKMGASGLGYEIAREFGLAVVPTRAALVPFTLSEEQLAEWSGLAGVAVEAEVECGKQRFQEGVLFTHRGLSGPAMLEISSYWQVKQTLRVNLAPGRDVGAALKLAKNGPAPKPEAGTVLSSVLPKRLAQRIAEQHFGTNGATRLADMPDKRLERLAAAVNEWKIVPHGTEGYRTAEVTMGGVDTAELSSKTMASRKVENLYFIGEVVDVTGQLGGFNFQWAWASGFVAGQYA